MSHDHDKPAEAQGAGDVERLKEALGRIAALDPRKLTWFGGFNRAQEIAMDALAAAPHAPAGGEVACDCAARFYGDDRDAHQGCCATFKSTPQRADAEDVERHLEAAANGVREYLSENTGFGTSEGRRLMACYGGNWIALDPEAIARAALAAMPRASQQAGMEREVTLTDAEIAKFWPDMDHPEGRAEIRSQLRDLLAALQPAREG